MVIDTKINNNILVIDDSNEKSVINYSHSDINSNFIYKVRDFKDLTDIYTENPENIFQIDTSNTITIIYENGEEKSLHKISNKSDIKPVFLRFKIMASIDAKNKIPKDMFIRIDKNHLIPDTPVQYMCLSKLVYVFEKPEDKTAYYKAPFYQDGYNISKEVIKKEKTAPAFKYCNTFKYTIGKYRYEGHLPSSTELYTIAENRDILNFIFRHLNSTEFMKYEKYQSCWWTANENNESTTKILYFSEDNELHCKISWKTSKLFVLPLFKQIPLTNSEISSNNQNSIMFNLFLLFKNKSKIISIIKNIFKNKKGKTL